MRKYGALHATTDFVERLIAKQGGVSNAGYVLAVLAGLKRLDAVQERNPSVTLAVTSGGGVWVFWDGRRYFMMLPGQKALRVLTDERRGPLTKALRAAAKLGKAVDTRGGNDYLQWNIFPDGLETIWKVVETLPQSKLPSVEDTRHPRYFPGVVREAAYSLFLQEGQICPGVDRPRHRVDISGGERIEFDHVLPYSQGGSRSEWNVQVLCEECNRRKRATSL